MHLLQKSGKEAADLRRAVTSPGGTTAAAINVLDEGKFRDLMARAVKAAHERAIELGGGSAEPDTTRLTDENPKK